MLDYIVADIISSSKVNEKTKKPQRTRPGAKHWIDELNRPNILFVTTCTKDRRAVLDNDAAHIALIQAWRTADRFSVGHYVVMPDHVHFFCSPRCDEANLDLWMRYWKRLTTQTLGYGSHELWQRVYWDTQIRSVDHFFEREEYVRMNPVRKELVSVPEEWLFKGCLELLEWP